MPMPKSFSLTLDETAGLEMTGDMASEADAKNLADVIQGGLAMVKMQANNPEVQKQAPGVQNLLAAVVVKAEGRVVRLAAPGAGGTAAIGAMAAIAIPSLLRARVSANEAAAIGDTRTVISAQVAYSSANGGAYGSMTCLSQPATCMKAYKGPNFVDEQLAGLQPKNGYKRAFHGGKAGTKPNSFRGYAYTATPVEPGKTGVRSFCGDDTGLICTDAKGAEFTPVGGKCPKGCTPLQ
jgi:type II secretory pathway pseudopilin PulG